MMQVKYILELIRNANLNFPSVPNNYASPIQEEFFMAGKGNAKSGTSQAKDMGSKGGKSGGPARARKLTTQQRSEIARKGAVAKNAKKK
jgi:hypothetical protein